MLKRHPKNSFQKLHSIVEAQRGFFTTKQAKAAGYDERHHGYHVRSGNWIREHRGIYRLANFPRPERPDLVLWSLWSRNRKEVSEGVYSHQTALSLHELSDVMPAKLHMTVPRQFRRSGPIPRALILHKVDLPKSEIETIQGVHVAKPLWVVATLLREGSVSQDALHQALHEALSRGLITRREVKRNPHLSPSIRETIEKIIQGFEK